MASCQRVEAAFERLDLVIDHLVAEAGSTTSPTLHATAEKDHLDFRTFLSRPQG